MEARDEDQMNDEDLRFHQEFQQWCEEQELQDEALEDYVNALCRYYGNLRCG